MYQAGIKNITLYENKQISFEFYDALNIRAITNLSGLGNILTIENNQRPEFDIKFKLSDSGNVTHEYSLDFFLYGISNDNYNLLAQLKQSIYGWCFLVEFYDGTLKFYNTPLFCRESNLKPQEEMAFVVKLENKIPSTVQYLEYTPDVSSVPIYRWDSEILTFDSKIYTFDYEL